MAAFIGRRLELKAIEELFGREMSAIAVIYGRRRVGKSELIRQSLKGKPFLYFEGLENQGKAAQIANFISQLKYQTRDESSANLRTWRDTLMCMLPYILDGGAIVLDEFQWIANYRVEMVSELKMVWEQYISKKANVVLILCGSIASFMITKVLRSSAFYGRSDLVLHLKPFQLDESAAFFPERSKEEVLEAQMIFGGIPKYFELIKPFSSIYAAVQSLAFSANGYFSDEFDRIFTSHFGRNPSYQKIIEILAKHPYGLSRIDLAKKANITEGGPLSQTLFNLEAAGFISSFGPFDKKKDSRLIRYRLSDSYMHFYFSFIKPEILRIQKGILGIFERISQSQAFASWLGRAFELLVIDHAVRISEILGFSGIDYSFGPYFRRATPEDSGVQIDLLFDRADKVITLCEMKYGIIPSGLSLIAETERKVAILKKVSKKTIQKVLITRTRPSRELSAKGYFYRIIQAEELFRATFSPPPKPDQN